MTFLNSQYCKISETIIFFIFHHETVYTVNKVIFFAMYKDLDELNLEVSMRPK